MLVNSDNLVLNLAHGETIQTLGSLQSTGQKVGDIVFFEELKMVTADRFQKSQPALYTPVTALGIFLMISFRGVHGLDRSCIKSKLVNLL
jgi:hypothetical protein